MQTAHFPSATVVFADKPNPTGGQPHVVIEEGHLVAAYHYSVYLTADDYLDKHSCIHEWKTDYSSALSDAKALVVAWEQANS